MSNIYETLVSALGAHWKAHGNRYPQKIVLSSAQLQALQQLRTTGRVALGTAEEPERDRFFGTPLVVDDTSPGELVSADGDVAVWARTD